MKLTDEKIIEMANQCTDPVTEHFDTIAFARLVAKRQREIDAIEAGNFDRHAARAILAQQ